MLSPLFLDLTVLVTGALGGAVMAAVLVTLASGHPSQETRIGLPRLGRAAACGGAVVLAAVCVGTISEALLLWLLLLAGASSPLALYRVRRAMSRVSGPEGSDMTHLDGRHLEGRHLEGRHLEGGHLEGGHLEGGHLEGRGTTQEALARLTSSQLCQVWRSSHRHLQAAASPVETIACVQLRQMLLEELERRHPEAVAAWLTLDADAAAGPERFLPSDPRNSSS
jgi:hypothetical protein